MRMAGPDVVLFVVGALLFGGATAAIVTSEGGLGAITGGGSPTGVYTVTFATRTVDGEPADLPSFTSGEATFNVNNTRVSTVTVVVTCSDPVPAGSTFSFTVAVAGPNGIAAEPATGRCGQPLEVPVEVAAVPATTTVQANTEAEAIQAVADDANATRAVGTWTVTVTGSRGAPALLPGGATDPRGSVLLRVETWEPNPAPVAK